MIRLLPLTDFPCSLSMYPFFFFFFFFGKVLCLDNTALFSHLVMSDSLKTPWTVACQAPLSTGFPSKNSGLGCHFLLQGTLLTQGSDQSLLCRQSDSLPLSHKEVVKHFTPTYLFISLCWYLFI